MNRKTENCRSHMTLMVLMILIFYSITCQASGEEKLTGDANRIDNLTHRLITLRGEVEDLNTELLLQREERKQQMTALLAQRSEIGIRLKRETFNQKKMRKTLKRNFEIAETTGNNAARTKPTLINAIENLEENIKARLPFKVDERLADLKEIQTQITSAALSPPRAANRLWAFFEDEIRLNRENGIYRQTISLNGEKILADVARLGMVMLYFRTPDDQYGMAKHDNHVWHYQVVTERTGRTQIARLFESLEKQIRTGFFEIPNPI